MGEVDTEKVRLLIVGDEAIVAEGLEMVDYKLFVYVCAI
jgi:hypothetical protein